MDAENPELHPTTRGRSILLREEIGRLQSPRRSPKTSRVRFQIEEKGTNVDDRTRQTTSVLRKREADDPQGDAVFGYHGTETPEGIQGRDSRQEDAFGTSRKTPIRSRRDEDAGLREAVLPRESEVRPEDPLRRQRTLLPRGADEDDDAGRVRGEITSSDRRNRSRGLDVRDDVLYRRGFVHGQETGRRPVASKERDRTVDVRVGIEEIRSGSGVPKDREETHTERTCQIPRFPRRLSPPARELLGHETLRDISRASGSRPVAQERDFEFETPYGRRERFEIF